MAADGAVDQRVQLIHRLLLGQGIGGFLRRLELQLEILLRGWGWLRLGVAVVIVQRAVRLAGERVHAERAARADGDRLQRVMGFSLGAGAVGGCRAKVYIKAGALCGGLHGLGRGGKRCLRHNGRDRSIGLLCGLLHSGRLLLREAARVRNDIINGMVRAADGIGKRFGQVLDALLLLLRIEQTGVVGGLGGSALLLGGLKLLVLRVHEQHNIGRGDCKEEHKPQQEHKQHQNIGGRAAKQSQQCGTDGRTEDAALPEIGATAGEQHLDDLADLKPLHIQLGEDDRHAGAEYPHQGHLARKQRDAVAGGQQIGKI